MTLLPSKVSFKDATGCGARSWPYREGAIFYKTTHSSPAFFSLSLIFKMVCRVCGQIPVHRLFCETFTAGDFPWDALFGKSDVNCKSCLNLS